MNPNHIITYKGLFESEIFPDPEIEKIFTEINGKNWDHDIDHDNIIRLISDSIENMLKKNGKYIELTPFKNYFDNNDFKEFRKTLHSFRHSDEKSLQERSSFAHDEKRALIYLGFSYLTYINSNIKKK